MFSFRSQGNHVSASLETGVQQEANVRHHQGWWRQRGAPNTARAPGINPLAFPVPAYDAAGTVARSPRSVRFRAISSEGGRALDGF